MTIFAWQSRAWFGYASAVLLTLAMTGVVALARTALDVPNISMLYLVAVLASAVAFGSGPAVAASLGSFLAFDFFFTEPYYTFTVAREEEWVGLGLLLVTGIVTGQLAAALRGRARQAERREREAVVLYDVVRLMMDELDLSAAVASVGERLRSELDLAAVVIELAAAGSAALRGEAGESEALRSLVEGRSAAQSILAASQPPGQSPHALPGRWIRVVSPSAAVASGRPRPDVRRVPVNAAGKTVGSIYVMAHRKRDSFRAEDDRLLSAAANQLGLALERARLREEATQAAALRETDQLKTALLNAVSHDLRTPLSSIIASAGSLLQRDVSWTDAERAEFARAIEQEALRLNRLVGNLLDLSRIEAGSLHPDRGWYDASALVQEVAGRLAPLTAGRNVRIEAPPDLAPVFMDYVEIDAVLTNLLENAARHTPAGTDIRIALEASGAELRVTVADDGPGVPDEALRRIFDAFYRGRPERPRAGMGLGLAVARGIVEAHGGRIWAENRPGGGASFIFTLPMSPAESRPAARAATPE